jgi:RNA polymerase sigma-70 factor (ECF subfamily)
MSAEVLRRANPFKLASDLELAQGAGRGDNRAFRTIVERNNAQLYRLARRVLKNDWDAEEAVQDAYTAAYPKLREFRGDSALSTWLTRIVLNQAFMHLRRSRRIADLGQALEHQAQSVAAMECSGAAEQLNPEEATASRQIVRLIERAVDALPIHFRTVFIMRCINELSVEETAHQLAILEATVKTRLHRARLLLRRALAEELEPFAYRRHSVRSNATPASAILHSDARHWLRSTADAPKLPRAVSKDRRPSAQSVHITFQSVLGELEHHN